MSLENYVQDRELLKGKFRKEFDNLYQKYLSEPDDSEIVKNIGNIFYNNQISLDLAKKYYLKAEKIDNFNPNVQYNLGLVAQEQNDYWDAMHYFANSIRVRTKIVQDKKNRNNDFTHHFKPIRYESNNDVDLLYNSYMYFEKNARSLLENKKLNNKKLNKKILFSEGDIHAANRFCLASSVVDITLSDFKNYKQKYNIFDIISLKANQIDPDIANAYDDRFYSREVIDLYRGGINPSIASSYDNRLLASDIVDLFKRNVSPEKTTMYPKHFDHSISYLINDKISPELSATYPKRFSGKDVAELVKMNIGSKKIPKYGKRFNGEGIIHMIKSGVDVDFAEKYDERFNGEDIAELYSMGANYKLANAFNKRFDAYEVIHMLYNLYKADIAEKFDKRFTGRDIVEFASEKIKPKLANSYSAEFHASEIKELIEKKVNPSIANKYLKKLSPQKITELSDRIPLDNVVKYPESYNYLDILLLYNNKITPEKVAHFNPKIPAARINSLLYKKINPKDTWIYDERFDGESIYYLASEHVAKEYANSFDKRFDGLDIVGFNFHKIKNEDAIKYSKKYNGSGIADLITSDITPEMAKKYSSRFNGKDISELYNADIDNTLAEKYHSRFSAWEIISLYRSKIKPEIANIYPYRFGASDIVNLVKSDISAKESFTYHPWLHSKTITLIHKMKNKEIVDLIDDSDTTMSLHQSFNQLSYVEEINNKPSQFTILDVGSQSVILFNKKDKTCIKYAPDYDFEYKLLKKIADSGKRFTNIISLKNTLETHLHSKIMELEFIEGDNLAKIIAKNGPISSAQAITYTSGIIQGLEDLRSVGVKYHRDIRPANIMIDKKKNIPIIIDLEFGTNKNEPSREGNRRFGNGNDLKNLGEVIYYSVTGNSVFAKSFPKKKDLSDIADEIEEQRINIYQDSTGVLMDLTKQKVDCTIEDTKLSSIIKELLTAKPNDHEKIIGMIR